MTTIAPETRAVFAAEHDAPIPYMQRTRDYYMTLGFTPYRWAHFAEVPFTPLPAPLPGRRRRRGGARPELTGVPPDRGSGRPAPRGAWHRDRDHGLRERHRRALRGPALRVQRLPARQLGRPAVRRRVADADTRACPARSRERAGSPHDRAVAAALERRRGLEARLPRPDEALAGEDRGASQGV